jgi:hypothetical protein
MLKPGDFLSDRHASRRSRRMLFISISLVPNRYERINMNRAIPEVLNDAGHAQTPGVVLDEERAMAPVSSRVPSKRSAKMRPFQVGTPAHGIRVPRANSEPEPQSSQQASGGSTARLADMTRFNASVIGSKVRVPERGFRQHYGVTRDVFGTAGRFRLASNQQRFKVPASPAAASAGSIPVGTRLHDPGRTPDNP